MRRRTGDMARVIFRLAPEVDNLEPGLTQVPGQPVGVHQTRERLGELVRPGSGYGGRGRRRQARRRAEISPPGPDSGCGLRGQRLGPQRRRLQAAFHEALEPVGQEVNVAITLAGQGIPGLGRVGHAVGVENDDPLVFVRRQCLGQLAQRYIYRPTDMESLIFAGRADIHDQEVRLAPHQAIGQFLRVQVVAAAFHHGDELRLACGPGG